MKFVWKNPVAILTLKVYWVLRYKIKTWISCLKTSERFKGKVLKQFHNDVMSHQDEGSFLDLKYPCVDQLCNITKLRFACRDAIGVHFSPLEHTKEQFAHTGRITRHTRDEANFCLDLPVGSRNTDFHAKMHEDVSASLVIWSSIHDKHCVFSPSRLLLCENSG